MKHLLLILALSAPVTGMASTSGFKGGVAADESKEVKCLAMNVYHEARGEPHEGQLAVAYVTMNRVASPRYPKSVCEVVWQGGQFSWTKDASSDKPADLRAWQRAQRIARFVYENYFRLTTIAKGATDPSHGALSYYAFRKVNPDWARTMVATRQIGSHRFLKDDES